MSSYTMSNGEYISQSKIERLITKAKAQALENQFEEFRYNFCEQCGISSGTYLDCSHDISVKKAKDNGMAEQCFNVGNITILCRKCHQIKDGLV
jgi:hypothetical protein